MPRNRVELAFLLLFCVCCAQAEHDLEAALRFDEQYVDPVADPYCARGKPQGFGNPGQACCAMGCGMCGGPGCNQQPPGAACCSGAVINSGRTCNNVGSPCLIVEETAAETTQPEPSTAEEDDGPTWLDITGRIFGSPRARHEACFVWARGKGYLLGGRGNRGLDIFDPVRLTWTRGANPPTQMHHMQCVVYGKNIYVPTSWNGPYPKENNNKKMYVYNIKKNRWRTRRGLPKARRRGAAAAVVHDKKIYVVGGNIGGHGNHSMSLGWMDYYDLSTKTWVTGLPDLPDPRDHVGGAIVNGKLCVAGGRDGGQTNFFMAVVTSTYCYDFNTGMWQDMLAPIPAGRAGAATATTCDGKMIVAGGEGKLRPAFSQVDVFDGEKWETIASLKRARHGTGLGVSRCSCGQIFIASGSGARGGSPELDSTEVYLPDGMDVECKKY